MTNRQVITAWSEGRSGRAGSTHTDGSTLWSYNLVIGVTDEDGEKVVYDYRATSGHFISSTTSHHVSLAAGVGDHLEIPAA